MSSDDYSRIYSGLQHRSRLTDVRFKTHQQTSQQKLRRTIKKVSVSFCGSFGSFSSYGPSSSRLVKVRSSETAVRIFPPSTKSHVRSSRPSTVDCRSNTKAPGTRFLVRSSFSVGGGMEKERRDERCDPAAGTFSVHPPSFFDKFKYYLR
ncbi:hypothetical protein QQF64_012788 [Cirrhinus molitorella]|uniref:Uncharacterized protein n=1 Tax=Cirrhinus molitorella TaxID=172907 RepID=A0ABR3LWH7_9TELE